MLPEPYKPHFAMILVSLKGLAQSTIAWRRRLEAPSSLLLSQLRQIAQQLFHLFSGAYDRQEQSHAFSPLNTKQFSQQWLQQFILLRFGPGQRTRYVEVNHALCQSHSIEQERRRKLQEILIGFRAEMPIPPEVPRPLGPDIPGIPPDPTAPPSPDAPTDPNPIAKAHSLLLKEPIVCQ